jgi:hypothetical protein
MALVEKAANLSMAIAAESMRLPELENFRTVKSVRQHRHRDHKGPPNACDCGGIDRGLHHELVRLAQLGRDGEANYLTRSVRIDGRIVREYYGRGPLAKITAHQFAREADRLGRTKRWRKLRNCLEEADKLGVAFLVQTDFLLRACLLAAGFHSHRGAWRRRRNGFRETGDPLPNDLPSLMKRAGKGDIQAIEAIQKRLSNDLGLWQTVANLVPKIEATWLDLASKKDPIAGRDLQERLASLRRLTSSPTPSPIDFLMVERVVLTWLEAQACAILKAPSERIHMPETIQKLLYCLQQKSEKRHQRARERLLLARQKLEER